MGHWATSFIRSDQRMAAVGAKRSSGATLPPAPHASGQVIFDSIRTWKVRQFQRALLNARGRGSVKREIHQYDVAEQLLFAVDREAKRCPETKRIHFPVLFGKARDRCHASMVRSASQLIWQVAKECQASPREIEAALFMWGYNVGEDPEDG